MDTNSNTPDRRFAMSRNPLVRALGDPQGWTRSDLIEYIRDNDIEMVNFMYPAADGRLKTLNFVVNSLEYLETILSTGERVDGSSLFPFIKASRSDLYVIPRYSQLTSIRSLRSPPSRFSVTSLTRTAIRWIVTHAECWPAPARSLPR